MCVWTLDDSFEAKLPLIFLTVLLNAVQVMFGVRLVGHSLRSQDEEMQSIDGKVKLGKPATVLWLKSRPELEAVNK